MNKIIVFFDGSGCVSSISRRIGNDTKALDILPLSHIDLPMDIMDFQPKILGNWIPDKIWFSPPCETFSIVTARKGGGNLYYQTIKENNRVTEIYPREDFVSDKRFQKLTTTEREELRIRVIEKQKQHALFVDKTIEIIKYYLSVNPKLEWFIENPASGFIRYYLQGKLDNMFENKTTYCMYGSEYRKETSIFSNIKMNLKYCPKHKEGVVDLCGGHKDNLVQRYDHKAQLKGVVKKTTYLDRSSVPKILAYQVLTYSQFVVFH